MLLEDLILMLNLNSPGHLELYIGALLMHHLHGNAQFLQIVLAHLYTSCVCAAELLIYINPYIQNVQQKKHTNPLIISPGAKVHLPCWFWCFPWTDPTNQLINKPFRCWSGRAEAWTETTDLDKYTDHHAKV